MPIYLEKYYIMIWELKQRYSSGILPTGDRMTEYDLRKANRRFERYRSVYKDAPKSGVEEFNEATKQMGLNVVNNSSDSSFSSIKVGGSSCSLADDIYEMLKHRKLGNNYATAGNVVSSEERTLEVILKRDKNGILLEGQGPAGKSGQTGRYSSSFASRNDWSISLGTSGLGVSENTLQQPTRVCSINNTVPNSNHQTYGTTVATTNTVSNVNCAEKGEHFLKTNDDSRASGVVPILLKYTQNVGLSSDKVSKNTNYNNCLSGGRTVKKLAQKVNAKKLLLSEIRQQKPPDSAHSQGARLSDVYSDWSFSSESELDNNSYCFNNTVMLGNSKSYNDHSATDPKGQSLHQKLPTGRLVMATATSKAVINDPAGKKMTSLIAAASANAISDNPYVALAQATAEAASKVSQVVDMAVADPSKRGKVSLVVSSTVCAAGRDLSRCSRENITYSTTALDEAGCPKEEDLEEESLSSESVASTPPDSKRMNVDNNVQASAAPLSSNKHYKTQWTTKETLPHKGKSPKNDQSQKPFMAGPQYAGSERLLKLIQKPSFEKDKLIEQQTEDKQDKHQPVLSQRNLNLWSNLPENTLDSEQHLMRWKNSVNLTESKELRKLMEKENSDVVNSPNSTLNKKQPNNKSAVKDIRDQYMKSTEELNEEIKISRRNRYKAKIDKAKREYLQSKASVSDLYKNPQEFQKKFNVSIENIRLPEAPRGPYLEFLGKNGSLHSLKASDIKPIYHNPADSLYDREYERIVRQAERLWAPYKKRSMSALGKTNDHLIDGDFYEKGRSTGCLETTFDVGQFGNEYSDERSLQETDLDQVFLQMGYDPERDSRRRMKNLAQVKRKAKGQEDPSFVDENQDSRVRARSVDYLIDQKARDEIEPPENQLKKILGEDGQTTSNNLSEHEIRFMKSADKLHVPNWYAQSDYCGSNGKPSVDLASRKSSPTFVSYSKSPETGYNRLIYDGQAQAFIDYSKPLETGYNRLIYDGAPKNNSSTSGYPASEGVVSPAPTFDEIMGGYQSRQSNKVTSKQPSEHTRYGSPWTYGDKQAPLLGSSSATGHKDSPSAAPRTAKINLHNYDSGVTSVGADTTTMTRPHYIPASHGFLRQTEVTTTTTVSHHLEEISTTTTKSAERRGGGDPPPEPEPLRQHWRQERGFETVKEPQPRSLTVKIEKDDKVSPIKIPSNFFHKYKEEIEEMRKSRANLNTVPTIDKKLLSPSKTTAATITRVPSYCQGNNIPIATVRPSSFSQSGTYSTVIGSPHKVITTTRSPIGQGSTPSTVHQGTPSVRQKRIEKSYSSIAQNGEKKSVQISEKVADTIRYERHDDSFDSTGNKTDKSFDSTNENSVDISNDVRRRMDGWTVSTVPASWNLPGMRRSVVIEVSDQFLDSPHESGRRRKIPGANGTLEEVLDKLLNLPTYGQKKISELHESSSSLNNLGQVFEKQNGKHGNFNDLGIYTNNNELMVECRKHPEQAEELLEDETLWVRCSNCDKARHIWDARQRYVSCHYCFTYYCGRPCRKADWHSHKEKRCTFARISTLCKGVIVKARLDSEAQWQMSRVARQGYSARDRGSVNFRFNSPFLARKYIEGGWESLDKYSSQCLTFLTIDEMVEAKKEPNLIKLCRLYDPEQKFVLSVSIIAEIEDVPETPLAERKKNVDANNNNAKHGQESIDNDNTVVSDIYGQPVRKFERSRSVPNSKRKQKGAKSSKEDTKSILRSILRSVENIAPGPVYISAAQRNAPYGPVSPQKTPIHPHDPESPNPFERNSKERSTAIGIEKSRQPVHQHYYENRYSNTRYNSGNQWKPCSAFGEDDLDETEV